MAMAVGYLLKPDQLLLEKLRHLLESRPLCSRLSFCYEYERLAICSVFRGTH